MLRVLVVDPSSGIGGPHQVTLRLVRALRSRVEFHVVAREDAACRYRMPGVEVYCQGGIQPLWRGLTLRQATRMLAASSSAIATLAGIIRRRKIDVVHSVTPACPLGGVAARLTARRSLYHAHDLTLGASFASGAITRFILASTADGVICVSHAVQKSLPNPGKRTMVAVVPNGVDVSEFEWQEDPRVVRGTIGLPADCLLVAAFGALNWRKGQEFLLKAAPTILREVPTARFAVVGGDSPGSLSDGYGHQVKDLVRSLGLHDTVRFIPQVTNVARFVAAADVVVQPSILDAAPLVPLEAMAAGKPVVGSDVGGLPEQICDGVTGYLVPPRDTAALARRVIELLRDPGLRSRMGDAGRTRVSERFSLTRQAEAIASLYEGRAEATLATAESGIPNTT